MPDSTKPKKTRRPVSEVRPFVQQLHKEMPNSHYWVILGSWRRNAPEIGDLDIMVITDSGTFEDFRFPGSFLEERRGERIAQGTYYLHDGPSGQPKDLPIDAIHMDFWACKPNEVGAFSMFMTGPKLLNIEQRAWAQKLGWTLSQYGLLDRDGKQIDIGTERDIYTRLGLPYMEPEARQAYAEVVPPPETVEHKYRVPSDSGPFKYVVKEKGGKWTCAKEDGGDCPAFKYSREFPPICKHIKKVQRFLASKG